MCGIIGFVGDTDEPLRILLNGLNNLEYRGYDSAGVALTNKELTVVKRSGEVQELESAVAEQTVEGEVGIGHTRWSTHGSPTNANAHPHTDCNGQIAVVHNGIIENFKIIRDELEQDGHNFSSQTDTEVIPHLIEEKLADGFGFENAFLSAVDRLEGSYALASICADCGYIMATRQNSPLVVGIGDEGYYLGSDVPAFLEYTDKVVYLEDREIVKLAAEEWKFIRPDSINYDERVETVRWESEETGKGGFKHYMLKEIHEQPRALRQTLRGRVNKLEGTVLLDSLNGINDITDIHFIGCGTSYHAALFARLLFQEYGLSAQAFLASEYSTITPPINEETLVVGITQSGETADTLGALREAKQRSAQTMAVTNVVGSSVVRETDHSLFIRAGPEIGVAATKSFSSQVLCLQLLALKLIEDLDIGGQERDFLEFLRDLPGHVQEVLDESQARNIAENYVNSDAYFFIGRGLQYPVALEGALKLKEITYKHAEGFAAGEMKHGPLALVTERTPVIASVVGASAKTQKTVGNLKEVETRGAPVIVVTDSDSKVEDYADDVLQIPESADSLAPILANIQYQLFAYYTAMSLDRSIDKPRNLAKSVTVE